MDRIICMRELRRLVPYSAAHIYRLESQGKFPRRVKIGAGRVGWLESELSAWLEELKALR